MVVIKKSYPIQGSSMLKYLILIGMIILILPDLSSAYSYSALISPTVKKVLISSKNRARFTRLSELNSFNISAACYTDSKNRAKLGIIKRQHFQMPLQVKFTANASQSVRSRQHSLRQALNRAAVHCRKLLQNQLANSNITSNTGNNSNTGGNSNSDQENNRDSVDQKIKSSLPFVPIPLLSEWKSQMLSYGRTHCQSSGNPNIGFDERLAASYYDAEWVFYRIGDYTNDQSWYACAQLAEATYGNNYVQTNNGAVPGYWNFSHGLTRNFLSTGNATSRQSAILLAENASYAPDWTPLSWTANANMSREVAYAIMSYLNAENLGQKHRARTEPLVAQALGHINQWTVSQTADYVRPFMFSLTAQALISYDSQIGGNSAILPAIRKGADWIWDHCWLPDSNAFKYTDRVVSSGGTDPAPDLNLLIAPVFAWLWNQTGDPKYRDRADQIFAGGVKNAWLVNAKQFNQNYRWSFDYVKWRTVPPLE